MRRAHIHAQTYRAFRSLSCLFLDTCIGRCCMLRAICVCVCVCMHVCLCACVCHRMLSQLHSVPPPTTPLPPATDAYADESFEAQVSTRTHTHTHTLVSASAHCICTSAYCIPIPARCKTTRGHQQRECVYVCVCACLTHRPLHLWMSSGTRHARAFVAQLAPSPH